MVGLVVVIVVVVLIDMLVCVISSWSVLVMLRLELVSVLFLFRYWLFVIWIRCFCNRKFLLIVLIDGIVLFISISWLWGCVLIVSCSVVLWMCRLFVINL